MVNDSLKRNMEKINLEISYSNENPDVYTSEEIIREKIIYRWKEKQGSTEQFLK